MGERQKRPARTVEERENYLISLAMDRVEQRLRDGTASSQETVHFLRLATERERLENERLRSDLRVADAKIKQMESSEAAKDLFEKALAAFRSYSPQDQYSEDEEGDYY